MHIYLRIFWAKYPENFESEICTKFTENFENIIALLPLLGHQCPAEYR